MPKAPPMSLHYLLPMSLRHSPKDASVAYLDHRLGILAFRAKGA